MAEETPPPLPAPGEYERVRESLDEHAGDLIAETAQRQEARPENRGLLARVYEVLRSRRI